MQVTTVSESRFVTNRQRRTRIGQAFYGFLLASTLIGLLMLVALLVQIFTQGIDWVRPELFNNFHSSLSAEKAGMKSAIVGSVVILVLTAVFSFPLGIGTAVYLEEYAPRNPLTNFLSVNIYNLAGVPSIVYGLLGLMVFSRQFGLFAPGSRTVEGLLSGEGFLGGIGRFFGMEPGERLGVVFYLFQRLFSTLDTILPGDLPRGIYIQLPFGNGLISGALTMTLLVLPVVIIASREAIRAVPPSIREAAFGLGATKWQVISRQVLPIAFPGIMTGMILALSRAMGESAPLIILGAMTYVPFLPDNIFDIFTVMPIQIYNWITLPGEDYRFHLAGAGILVLMVILITLNGIAIFLRNRFEIKW